MCCELKTACYICRSGFLSYAGTAFISAWWSDHDARWRVFSVRSTSITVRIKFKPAPEEFGRKVLIASYFLNFFFKRNWALFWVTAQRVFFSHPNFYFGTVESNWIFLIKSFEFNLLNRIFWMHLSNCTYWTVYFALCSIPRSYFWMWLR